MNHDLSAALRRRARIFRRARIAVLALVIGYFFLPYDVRAWIPVWLLFLAALGLEVEFFLGGYLQSRRLVAPAKPDRGPQPHDVAELGGAQWQEELTPEEFDELAAAPIEEDVAEPAEAPHLSRRYVVDLRHALPGRVQAPRAVVPAHGARDRRAGARVVAPPRRERRGPRQLLRVPERRPEIGRA